MVTRQAFIAVLVVAGDSCHQLLSLRAALIRRLLPEVIRGHAAQRAGQKAVMMDLDIAILLGAVREAEILAGRGILHFSGGKVREFYAMPRQNGYPMKGGPSGRTRDKYGTWVGFPVALQQPVDP